jgi:beta-1,4-mannooligosaccharide/beta-1,4-mannosyl-N-acetylglucosamine phosphorylase
MPFPCYAVYNAGATMFDGKVLLLLRVEDYEMNSDFFVATSADGVHFDVSPTPIDYPLSETEKRVEPCHRFDMRITRLDGKYYVCHAAWLGRFGCCIGMAHTEDFVSFTPLPRLSVPSNRNAVLFPEKIGGLYARIERPQTGNGLSGMGMWISYSPDLEFWGRAMPVDLPRMYWTSAKSGAGAIPIRTDEGWLEIYHGCNTNCSVLNYHLGACLLDLDDPSKVVAAPKAFILAPEKDYECVGQVPNVVFTSGAVEMPDGTLNVYYGAADTRTCLARTTVKDLVDYCLKARGR